MTGPTADEPRRSDPRSAFRQAMGTELRGVPRQMGRDLWEATLELLVNGAVAAAIIGVFGLVGYAIGGATGALLGGLVGVGAFCIARGLVLAGVVAWVVAGLLLARRRPR